MIERQVIVSWYDPAGLRLKRTLLPICYGGEEGWYSLDLQLDEVTVHGWCDLEPYKGGK